MHPSSDALPAVLVSGNPEADRNYERPQRRGFAKLSDPPEEPEKHLLAEVVPVLAEAEEAPKVPDHHR